MKESEMPEHIKSASSAKLFLLNDQGMVLLLLRSMESKRFKHIWDLPGGKVDSGESLEVALHRELKEETGLTCKVLTKLGERQFDIDGIPCQETLFISNLTGPGCVCLSDEHDDYRWVTLESLQSEELPLLPGMKEFILQCKELHND